MYDPYVKVVRDLSICQKCPKFQVEHVYYGCKRYYPSFSLTKEKEEKERKKPENQPFFCEEYDEYKCTAESGGGYKKDWFEHAIVNRKCVCYAEQYLNAVNKRNKEKKDGMA